MRINGQHFHTIWIDNTTDLVRIIDQQKLPFELTFKTLNTHHDAFDAIKNMTVRGAPLIGITAAFGMYLALKTSNDNDFSNYLHEVAIKLKSARPTAVNLAYAVDEMEKEVTGIPTIASATEMALAKANELKQNEIEWCSKIGDYGLSIIEQISKTKNGQTVNILTHCNAGWLACIDWGTALAPIYKAQKAGINVHVWVDETRPRNQGSRLTAFELAEQGIPHTVIVDNAGGHIMQRGMVDMVIVGSDRTTRSGDVCNKIGTYLKALAAFDNQIPFYVALPSSSIDFTISDGISEIEIEERDEDEVRFIEGKTPNGIKNVCIVLPESGVSNYGFDITPARFVTALITERGICEANEESIAQMFRDKICREK